jgi:hypothetical protein
MVGSLAVILVLHIHFCFLGFVVSSLSIYVCVLHNCSVFVLCVEARLLSIFIIIIIIFASCDECLTFPLGPLFS